MACAALALLCGHCGSEPAGTVPDEAGGIDVTADATVPESSTALPDAEDHEVGRTDASATDASATDASATDASATDASATDASATDASATDASATDASATDASATDAGRVDAGAEWRQVYLDSSLSDIKAIWGFGRDSALLAGGSGRVARWNGTTWTKESIPTYEADYVSVFGHVTGQYWLASAGSVREVYGPNASVSAGNLPFGNREPIVAGWSNGSGVYVITRDGTVFRGDTGGTMDLVAAGPPSPDGGDTFVRAAWSNGSSEVWAVGYHGLVMHLRGTTWTKFPSGTTSALLGIWGNGPDDVWAVGVDGITIHWDGVRWTRFPTGSKAVLNGVWGSGSSDVWAVGTAVLHWNGAEWRDDGAPVYSTLNAIWGSSGRDIWAVGAFGFVLHRVAP